ncbi:MAG: hypothetical protein ACLQAT_25350 [Candidatus Binataceae bacterium]
MKTKKSNSRTLSAKDMKKVKGGLGSASTVSTSTGVSGKTPPPPSV